MKLTLGQRIYYTGDQANIEDAGVVVAIRPPCKFAPESYDVDLDDGRRMRGIYHMMFDPGVGRRFWPLDEWLADHRQRINAGIKAMKQAAGKPPNQ